MKGGIANAYLPKFFDLKLSTTRYLTNFYDDISYNYLENSKAYKLDPPVRIGGMGLVYPPMRREAASAIVEARHPP